MIIQVNEQDIAQGTRCNCWSCPIVLAVNRALNLPELTHSVMVADDSLVVIDNLSTWERMSSLVANVSVSLPGSARRFIKDFDHGVSVKPFTFEIEDRHDILKRLENARNSTVHKS